MVTISAVSEGNIESATRELLNEELLKRRLGFCGLYAANVSNFVVGLSLHEAKSFLHGYDVDGSGDRLVNPDGIAAWRFDFTGSQSLSVLYALASQEKSADIRSASTKAALIVLQEVAGCVSGPEFNGGILRRLVDPESIRQRQEDDRTTQSLNPGQFISVAFGFGASSDQNPSLQTTAFLMNTTWAADHVPRSLIRGDEIEQFRHPVREAYAGALDYFVSKAIGPFERAPNIDELRIVGVPQRLVQKFFYGESVAAPAASEEIAIKEGTKRELFEKWRAQAQDLGWGPKEAAALLRELKQRQFWGDIRSNCQFAAASTVRALVNTGSRLKQKAFGDDLSRKKTMEKDQEQDNSHSH